MSNPTTLVEQFDASLGAFIGVNPIRHANGLWVEQSGSNLIPNPWRAVNNTGWAVVNGITARTTLYHLQGPGAGLVTASGANAEEYVSAIVTVPGQPYYITAVAQNLAAVSRSVFLDFEGTNPFGTVVVPAGAIVTLGGQITADGSESIGMRWTNSANGEQFVTYYLGLEPGTRRTSPCPQIDSGGTVLAGYTWAGTTHNSASTRAPSSASLSPAGILAPDTGSLAFRFRRLIDTGGTETLLECGTAGSGTDYLSISVNSSDKLVVSWNSDNAGAQTVTSTESIAVDTEYFVYTEWASGTMGLSIDNGDLVVGARDAVEGDWGVGELVLEAT